MAVTTLTYGQAYDAYTPVDRETRGKVLEACAAALKRAYIFEDVGARMAQALQDRKASEHIRAACACVNRESSASADVACVITLARPRFPEACEACSERLAAFDDQRCTLLAPYVRSNR
jgi:hypothetical protein